jgi:hypothetical protein
MVGVELDIAVLSFEEVPAALVARELGPLHHKVEALLLYQILHLLHQMLPQHLIHMYTYTESIPLDLLRIILLRSCELRSFLGQRLEACVRGL